MPIALAPIPTGVPITERDGTVTDFFRLRWQELLDGFLKTGAVAAIERTGENAAIATTAAFTTISEGLYRVSWYVRKTTADGVSSSLTVTLGWTHRAVALTEAGAALATDAVTAQQSGSKLIRADASSDITFAVAYASNTPGQMVYEINVICEQVE